MGLLLALLFTGVLHAAPDADSPAAMRWAPSRSYHVENYKLRLHFDQARREVFGDEIVTIRPFAAGFDRFCINSEDMTIESVALVRTDGAVEALPHETDNSCLWISLQRAYGPSDSLGIRIVYHGVPSAGLYFVNPGKDDPGVPPQIYTQGEPEFNHHWFPCWDYPNDMATSETITTVPEGQVVVSNGTLESVKHAGGQVTYDWVEHVPHSAYLLSLAIGPWKQLHDSYDGKPVDYFVDRRVDDATALRTFHLTPDMIGFFSRATGIGYPYEKYDQVTVHDFIFGGQENVSATTLVDEALHDARAEADYPSTILVAHELGQHWFGDYVQGRDWANIWLNEGFATYLTALYTQYHESNDAYRYEIYGDQKAALHADATENNRPIVYRKYVDPMDMLEQITHEKGASVLDMMRYVLDGESAMTIPASQNEIMFHALNDYLAAHHAQTADTADLISSIRSSSGQDLSWFFYEWVFKGGHPAYRVSASYDPARRMEIVKVAQTREVNANTPIFDMPIHLAFFGDNNRQVDRQVRDDAANQEFDIPLVFKPKWVDFDPDDVLFKTVAFPKPDEELGVQALHDPHMMSRLWAVKQLGEHAAADKDCCVQAIDSVLNNDAFYGVRIEAASSLGQSHAEQAKRALLSALGQDNSQVRTAVVGAMGHFLGDPGVRQALLKAMRDDPSYAVQAAAAEQIGRSGSPRAFDALRAVLASTRDINVTIGALNGLAAMKTPQATHVVFTYAKPGPPKRVRLVALTHLQTLKDSLPPDDRQAVTQLVGDAIEDSFLEIHEIGVQLVGTFGLRQFRPEVERDARRAVIMDDRVDAQHVLEGLDKK
ncbi:M1 family metallopeptidase [Rhodanobacter sp. 7MK24]|uniref:M1 family metallopeptidase n=1 Tax=Rhodanobacter sp. 7MK24 TaxID=2775922 RepID=UPI00177D9BC8|nr:M1 family metallopeptidase [Rhodanobacter sp. 7MK24]MBD8880768.1 M1 family metallopeptidase [Rhodanobacter sp. 7MK24]